MTEASYLNTGYAKYGKQVLSRMFDTGKYEIAEFSTYGGVIDPRRRTIKWKNYPNMPDPENEEENKLYQSNPVHQFGSWRFERACLDFEPDIVLTIRDFWMDSFIYHSPFRSIFSWAWMPTVDASPQNPEWLDMFADADYVLTYSDWAKGVIDSHSGDTTNTVGSASPSASDEFKQMDKNAVRAELGIPTDINIIGTVMRNQRRKLFPALIQSFSEYLKETKSTNTYLYLHTSFPDAGWDLASLIQNHEVSSRILMTYVCSDAECQHVECSFFRDAKKGCSKCGKYSSAASSVSNGVSDEMLAKIYNSFDLYIQLANSEGFGLPQVEAAACGVPIACTNYSAMEDVVQKLGAYPIDFELYKELETGCDRAVPKIDSVVNVFKNFFKMDEQGKLRASENTRSLFEEHYSWDKTAEAWMKIIDQCEYADWNSPARPRPMPPKDIKLEAVNAEDFIEKVFGIFSFYPSHNNSWFSRSMLTDFMRGSTRANYDGYYVSQFSPFSDIKPRTIVPQQIVDTMYNRLANYNNWEIMRDKKDSLDDKRANTWLI